MPIFTTYGGIDIRKAVIFAPENGFELEAFAELIVQIMQATNMGAKVSFPNDIVADLDPDCTAEEIIDGYREFIGGKISPHPPANGNKILTV